MGVWVWKEVGIPVNVGHFVSRWLVMMLMMMMPISVMAINGDGDASDFDHEIFGYLKWTDGLRSRWVPAGISYPESTRS